MRHKLFAFLIVVYQIVRMPVIGQPEMAYQNQQFQYNPDNKVHIESIIAQSEIKYHVLLKITLPDIQQIDQYYTIWYSIKDNLDQTFPDLMDTIDYAESGKWTDQMGYIFSFNIPKDSGNNILTINIKHINEAYIYQTTYLLNHEITFPFADFYLINTVTGLPLFNTYASSADTLRIENLSTDKAQFYVYYYSKDFEIADPPMYLIDRKISRSLEIDSIFTVQEGQQFNLDREGF